MTQIEWAGYLNNREYSEVLSRYEATEAKKDNVIVAWVPYDGILYLKGEIDVDIIFITDYNRDKIKVVTYTTQNDYKELLDLNLYKIGNAWAVYSGTKCESFNILNDGLIYCIGAVIKLNNEDVLIEKEKRMSENIARSMFDV